MEDKKPLVSILASFGKIWLEKEVGRWIRPAVILILIQVAVILFFFAQLPPQIPLFFSRPWGEPQLASPLSLLLLPLFSLTILLVNTFLAAFFIDKDKFLSQALSFASVIFALFGLIAILKIIFLFV